MALVDISILMTLQRCANFLGRNKEWVRARPAVHRATEIIADSLSRHAELLSVIEMRPCRWAFQLAS
jgi:hypothetical protein